MAPRCEATVVNFEDKGDSWEEKCENTTATRFFVIIKLARGRPQVNRGNALTDRHNTNFPHF